MIIRKRGRVAIVVVTFLIFGIIFYGVYFKKSSRADSNIDLTSNKRDTQIAVESNGKLKITRENDDRIDQTMGQDEKWTIFAYICGSDLEYKYNAASSDIEEMLSANFNDANKDNLDIIIQTGGAKKWSNPNISANKSQRFRINNGKLELISETSSKNMGDPETLYDFLNWGIKNYPSEHMGVLFWDHGNGAAGGICQDNQNKKDTLEYGEIESVFCQLNKEMTCKFDAIICDTCVTCSIETANFLAPYAKYLIASPDTMPINGLEYKSIVNAILKNGDIEPLDLGKVVCDSFYQFYKNNPNSVGYMGTTCMMSVIDLSKVNPVCEEIHELYKRIDEDILANERGAMDYYHEYVGNAIIRRYLDFNVVDIGAWAVELEHSISSQKNSCIGKQDTSKLVSTLKDLVVYTRMKDTVEERATENGIVYGISMMDCGYRISSGVLNILRNICVSPNQYSHIELMNSYYAKQDVSEGKKDRIGLPNNNWINNPYFHEETFAFTRIKNIYAKSDGKSYSILKREYPSQDFYKNWEKAYGKMPGMFTILTQMVGSVIDTISEIVDEDKNKYKINKEFKDNYIASYDSVYIEMGDKIISLGEKVGPDYNAQTGEINSKFDGEWFMLSDGQFLPTMVENITEEGITYRVPVLVSNIEMTMLLYQDNLTSVISIVGLYDTRSKNLGFGRQIPITSGLNITPIYDVYQKIDGNEQNIEEYEVETIYGEEYCLRSNDDFLLGKLKENEYVYAPLFVGLNNQIVSIDVDMTKLIQN